MGQCNPGDIVQGFAQDTSGFLDTILCLTPPASGNIASDGACYVQNFANSDSPFQSEGAPDWDYENWKGYCTPEYYVHGVAVNNVGSPQALQCCSPTAIIH